MNKKVLYLIIFVIFCVIGTIIFYNNTSIEVSVNPSDAQIKLDNNSINLGKTKLKPGSHNLKITKKDYVSYDKTINVSFGVNKKLSIDLRPLPLPEKIHPTGQFLNKLPDENTLNFLDSQHTMIELKINKDKLQTKPISPSFFKDVTNIIWSPDNSLAILKQQSETSLFDFNRYDLLHQEIIPYKDNGIKDIIWSPDSSHIYYYYNPENGEKTLIKANKTNTDVERLYNFKDTDIKNPKLQITPDEKTIILLSNNKIYLFDIFTKKITNVDFDKPIKNIKIVDEKQLLTTSDNGELNVFNLNKLTFTKIEILPINLDNVTINNQKLIGFEKNNNEYKFFEYDLNSNIKTNYYYQPTLTNISKVYKIDNNIYFESNRAIYSLKTDNGVY